jgi:hypothetical protein
MTRTVLLTFAAAATAAALHTSPARAQTPPKALERGYTRLFDGRDLTGWKVGGDPADFRVVDGAIQANGAPNPAHLFYDGPFLNHTFKDFDLRLEVMAKAKSNGGIYICTTYQDTGFPQTGFEIQLNNSHTDRVRTGSLYHVVDLSYVPAKDDEWFPMEIMLKNGTITVFLKGQKVVEWKQPADWTTNYDTKNRRIGPGTIAFQAHDPNSFTYYRNVRIKPL